MGSRNCFVGSSEGNPEHRICMAQPRTRSALCRRRGLFPSVVEEVAVVDAVRLQCFQCFRGRETRPSLRLNLCYR